MSFVLRAVLCRVLQEPRNMNVPSIARSGRLLGRCHAALGEHALAVAALDAALEASRAGELLYNEALTVRARALVGKAATAAVTATAATYEGPHWLEGTGKQRVVEVMGRMSTRSSALATEFLLQGLQ